MKKQMTRVLRSTVQDQRLETDTRMEARLRAMQDRPNDFIVRRLPEEYSSDNRYMFTYLLQHIDDKLVLDLGCGDGAYAVYLLRQGAQRVCAVDISERAVLAVCMLAELNGLASRLFTGVMDGGRLAYQDGVFDIVFGRAILHHFPDNRIHNVMREVYRVLKVGGEAVFLEPVEDSSLFERIQRLVPAGRVGTGYYRPSCLSRTKFMKYTENEIDAPLTTKVLLRLGYDFDDVHIEKFGLLIRFDRFTFGRPYGQRARFILDRIDRMVFRLMPFLRRYCRTAVVCYRKLGV